MLDTLEKEAVAAEAGTAAVLPTVAVVGLGYVGLPVAVEFGKRRSTIGYDLEDDRRRFHVTPGGVVVIPKGMKVS